MERWRDLVELTKLSLTIPGSSMKSFRNGRISIIFKDHMVHSEGEPPFERLQEKLKELSLTKNAS
jgi:hypothetical protein